MLSLTEIQNPNFTRVRGNAYSSEDVDAYIAEVVETVNELKRRYSHYKTRCANLENTDTDYNDKSKALSDLLVEMRLTALQAKKNAEDEASQIVEEAKKEADDLISVANKQLTNAEAAANQKYDEIVAEANVKSASIIADAKKQADELVDSAKAEYDALKGEYDSLVSRSQSANEAVNNKLAAAKELYASVFQQITAALDSVAMIDIAPNLE